MIYNFYEYCRIRGARLLASYCGFVFGDTSVKRGGYIPIVILFVSFSIHLGDVNSCSLIISRYSPTAGGALALTAKAIPSSDV